MRAFVPVPKRYGRGIAPDAAHFVTVATVTPQVDAISRVPIIFVAGVFE